MQKFCLPLLTLALGLPALAHARDDKLPSPDVTGAVRTSLTASASASATITISDQDALADDILAVLDLPFVAADAREAGIEEAELREVLETTRDSGLSASDASELVLAETEQTRKRGVKRGFGLWVRMQVASGLRGKKLAAKIKERKQDTPELDEAQLAALRLKVETQREVNQNWRRGQLAKRGELIAKGKKTVLMHRDRHDQLKAKLDAAQGQVGAAQSETNARLSAIEGRLAAATEAEKATLEAEKLRLEKELGKLEKREDKLEKREDKLEKREDKLEKREDKLDDRAAKAPGKPPQAGKPEQLKNKPKEGPK